MYSLLLLYEIEDIHICTNKYLYKLYKGECKHLEISKRATPGSRGVEFFIPYAAVFEFVHLCYRPPAKKGTAATRALFIKQVSQSACGVTSSRRAAAYLQ